MQNSDKKSPKIIAKLRGLGARWGFSTNNTNTYMEYVVELPCGKREFKSSKEIDALKN